MYWNITLAISRTDAVKLPAWAYKAMKDGEVLSARVEELSIEYGMLIPKLSTTVVSWKEIKSSDIISTA